MGQEEWGPQAAPGAGTASSATGTGHPMGSVPSALARSPLGCPGWGETGGVPQGSSSQSPGDPRPGRAGAAPVELPEQQGLSPGEESGLGMEPGTSLGTLGQWEGSAPTARAGETEARRGDCSQSPAQGISLEREEMMRPGPGMRLGCSSSIPASSTAPASPSSLTLCLWDLRDPQNCPKPPQRTHGGAGTANPLPTPGCRASVPANATAREGLPSPARL